MFKLVFNFDTMPSASNSQFFFFFFKCKFIEACGPQEHAAISKAKVKKNLPVGYLCCCDTWTMP